MPKSFWFHEDEYAETEVLPLDSWNFCTEQFAKIEEHEKAHRLDDGIGWTKMYIRPPSPLAIVHLGIHMEEIRIIMPWRLRPTDRVLTGGWSGEGDPLQDTTAYCADKCAIIVSWNAADMVDRIWFYGSGVSFWHRGAVTEAFARIGQLRPSLLVDWKSATLIDLTNRQAIKQYLSASSLT